MHKYCLRIEGRDQEIMALKENIKGLEKQLFSKVKSQLLDAKGSFSNEHRVNGDSSKVNNNNNNNNN